MKRTGRGFTLTEMLVATLLLALATAGGITTLTRIHSARADAATLQQLHERAQYAFATLEPELQMAGYFGVGGPPAAGPAAEVPVAARRCGTELVQRLDLAVQWHPAWNLACDARGGGAASTAGVLVVRRLSARLADRPEAGRAQWLARTGQAGSGHIYWNGDAPRGPDDAAAGGEMRELIVRAYYVARAADGDASMPALRVKSLTSIAGEPAFVDTEVMHGIEDLQAELLPSVAAPRVVRLRLRVRADAPSRIPGGVPRTLEVTRQYTLRNAYI